MKDIIEAAWDNRELLDKTKTQEAIKNVISLLDNGKLRVAEKINDQWKVNDWVKKAVILFFPISKMESIEIGPFEFHDKIPLKNNYKEKGVRVVPHSFTIERQKQSYSNLNIRV